MTARRWLAASLCVLSSGMLFAEDVSARVVCSSVTQGNRTIVTYCDPGFLCEAGRCVAGPERRKEIEQRKRDEQARNLQSAKEAKEAKEKAKATARAARKGARQAEQARRSPSSDGRMLTQSGGDPRRVKGSCSTITGLPGASGGGPCATTGKVTASRTQSGAKQATAPARRAPSLGQRILRGQPPGTAAVLADADDDPLDVIKKIAEQKQPGDGSPPAPDIPPPKTVPLKPNEICEDKCGGRVINPNKGATVTSIDACAAGGGIVSDIGARGPDDDDTNVIFYGGGISGAVWPRNTRWCVGSREPTRPQKIKDDTLSEKVCVTNDGTYKNVVDKLDPRCAVKFE